MSDGECELSRKVIELEKELHYWQKCYYRLNEKYQNIKACHKCINENEEEVEGPLAIRQKISSEELDVVDEQCDLKEILKDPLKCLPEPVAIKIFDYLKGLELLPAMEVSKSWRDFIKVQGVLMKKIVFAPTGEICEFPLLNEIFNEENMRPYKHFDGPIYLRKNYLEARPIEFLSSTLETLIVRPNKVDENVNSSDAIGIQCNFPKLTMLVYPINSPEVTFDLLENSTFPVLTHLKLYSAVRDNPIDIKKLKEFLCLFPKLEAVMFDDNSCKFEFLNSKTDDEMTKELPKVKALYVPTYYREISDIFQASLEKLGHCYLLYLDNLKSILKNCKNLKSCNIFSMSFIDEVSEFERNDSLEILTIYEIKIRENSGFTIENTQTCLKKLLTALPSLKELRLDFQFITDEILKFIAKNMINLKALYCHFISQELQRSYHHIRENPNIYVNTTFEFTNTIGWNKIKDDFPVLRDRFY